MDQASAIKTLQGYGAPITPRNMQLVMEQGGSDSAILGRSMGLQGAANEEGYDDSILRSKLDKLDTASQRTASPPLVIPEQGTPNDGSLPPTANVARAPIAPIRGRSGGAGMTEPDVPPQGSTAAGSDGSGVFPWILAALGIKASDSLLRGKSDVSGAEPLPEPMPANRNPVSGKPLSGPAKMLRLEGPQAALPAPINPAINPANEAVDKIASQSEYPPTESSRPINTNADERNSEPVNKPVNRFNPRKPIPDDSVPINLVEEIAKTLKRAPHGR